MAPREPPRLLSDPAADPIVRRLLWSARRDNPEERTVIEAEDAVMARLTRRDFLNLDVATRQHHPRLRLFRQVRWLALAAVFGSSLAAAYVGSPEVRRVAASLAKVGLPDSSALATTKPVTRKLSLHRKGAALAPSGALPHPAVADAPPTPTAVASVTVAPVTLEPPRDPEKRVVQVANSAPMLESPLLRELTLMERARTALSASKPAIALVALDEMQHLDHRALAPESTVLRVRALILLGRTGEAQSIANAFHRRAPKMPQNAVLRELLNPYQTHSDGD